METVPVRSETSTSIDSSGTICLPHICQLIPCTVEVKEGVSNVEEGASNEECRSQTSTSMLASGMWCLKCRGFRIQNLGFMWCLRRNRPTT